MNAHTEGRKVLVLGAGRGQVGLIRALQRLGARVVVATQMRPDLPGIEIADEILECDLRDARGVVQAARSKDIDAVATSCMDTAMHTLGELVDELGLRGVSSKAARLCNDKIPMKERLVACGVPTAAFEVLSADSRIEDVLDRIGLPAVVKAPNLQGSAGVRIVRDRAEALSSLDSVRETCGMDGVLVEAFLDGVELGAQAFIHDGEILFVMPHGDALAAPDMPIPVEHWAPAELSDTERESVEKTVVSAIRALGLDDCAVNVDLILVNGVAHVIELTGRAGANGLPELTGARLGLDYWELIARECLDLDVRGFWSSRAEGAPAVLGRMVGRSDLHGAATAVDVEDLDEGWLIDRTVFIAPGRELDGFQSSNDCLAQVIVSGDDLSECRERADAAAATIHVEVRR